jgi:phosphoribosylanthranilate isomerase
MSKTKIKICGLTNAGDARLCAEMGVDMLGLNFSPQSVRCIDLAAARQILSAVRSDYPEMKFIGLFVDQAMDLLKGVVMPMITSAMKPAAVPAAPPVPAPPPLPEPAA